MNKILVAGATGRLGSFVVKKLKEQKYVTNVLVRNRAKFEAQNIPVDQIIHAEITNKKALNGCCDDIDIVFSSVGITTQKDDLTYMDVDYQANLNLLKEAEKSGVEKFMYVSVLKGPSLKHLKICEAKEKFVDALKRSSLNYCVIRPNGFFSDMSQIFEMAKNGRVFLFGKGEHRINPIHGKDLADICVDAINSKRNEIAIGGPQTLTHNEIAKTAFSILGKKKKITYLPDWIKKTGLYILRSFTNSKIYGPIEFVMTVMSMDLEAPEFGKYTLERYFEKLEKKDID
ncbi:MAG TPA: SDR family oxidoreductase [Balneolaceae bacterium]|nr:SDR family oxidoreductase [Balneolaceae bacterium]